MNMTTRIGLISDTHGLLRPEALAALAGAEQIVHMGDIGNQRILDALEKIAPVHAVRGNNDTGAWADGIEESLRLEIAGVSIYVLHDANALALDRQADGVNVVIAGHSHRPSVAMKENVLFVNPGSAGPRRFKLPVSVGFLEIVDGKASASIVLLDV
jgi:putative phosphoesterase